MGGMEDNFRNVSRGLIMQTLMGYGEDFELQCCINCEVLQNCEPGIRMIRFTCQENESCCTINNGLERANIEVEKTERKTFH